MSEICAAMGRKLTRARRQHKLSMNDAAEELCISLHYLKALESGRLSELPGPVYALGFLRNYAELVDLDADELAGMAKHCLDSEEAAKRPHLPEPHRESRFPARLVLVGATSAMLLFFTAWPMVDSQVGSQAGIVPMLPAHLAEQLEQPVKAIPEKTQAGEAMPHPDEDRFLSNPPQPATDGPPLTEWLKPVDQKPGKMFLQSQKEPAETETPVEIRAIRDTWVEIKNDKDQTLLKGVIRSGDSFVPERTAQLQLTASDGGNLVLYIRGRPVYELGEPGHELRSVRLDVAGLLEDTS